MAYDEAEWAKVHRSANVGARAADVLRTLIELRDRGRRGKVELQLSPEQEDALEQRYDQLKAAYKLLVGNL